MKLIANVLLFQAAWCASIFGAAAGNAWLGPACMAVLVVIHVLIASTRRADLRTIPICSAIGIIAEMLTTTISGTTFAAHTPAALPIPLWMAAIWPGFATLLNSSMAWMQTRPLIAIAFGAIGGPVAYYGGASAGAVRLGDSPALALAAVAIQYAVLMPILCAIARTLAARYRTT
ncbi:MAG: DUF2878 domain-containing protein [Phycisphaerae bacterium]